jgi:GDP-L-fucose synthase
MLIDRFIDAKTSGNSSIFIWGTGQATRDFLYVSDAVRALEIAARIYNGCGAINLGTGNETKIIDLAETIAGHIGYTGDIKTDPSKPDGQPRRVLDITRARDLLNWTPRVTLDDGLTDTIEWRLGNA